MKSLVVYESFYGNTESIAGAIAEGLARHSDVSMIPVGELGTATLDGIDLLVVGAPTHAWGLPRATTRASVQSSRYDPAHGLMREWLATMPRGDGRPAAAFTTRLDKPRLLTGSAARAIARRLRGHDWQPTGRRESFTVAESPGPLVAGELERARAWGDRLAFEVMGAVSASR
jgi:hypothetical protein